jgi:hypothetical protein
MAALDPKPDELFVVWGGSFPYEWVLPWDNLERYRDFKAYVLGGVTNTPHTEGRLAEFGIANPAAALYQRPNVRLIACPAYVTVLSRFYVRHHGAVVTLDDGAGRPFIPTGLPGGAGERARVFRWRYLGPADDYMDHEWVRSARW